MGSEVKFTPGPWEIYTGETFGNGPNDWNPIAVYADIHTKRTTIATFRVNYPHGDQQQRDNARLIAAAPDLYEALQAMTDAYVALLLVKGEDPAKYRSPVLPYGKALAALSKAQPTNPTAQGDEQ